MGSRDFPMSPEIGLDSVQLSRLEPMAEVAVAADAISSLVSRDGRASHLASANRTNLSAINQATFSRKWESCSQAAFWFEEDCCFLVDSYASQDALSGVSGTSALGLGRVKTALGASVAGARTLDVSQAAIAAISGLIPTMFMTRVRL